MSSSSNSHYSVFLDNYNKGNNFLKSVAGSFLDQIQRDLEIIISNGTGVLKEKFDQIRQIAADGSKTNYERTAAIGSILVDVASMIYTLNGDKVVLKSGINVISSFLAAAKETQDQLLMTTAVRISDTILAPAPVAVPAHASAVVSSNK